MKKCIYSENLGQKVVSLASAPGRVEKEKAMPLAGQSGDNHDAIIKMLHYKGTQLFRIRGGKGNISINNAWPEVLYAEEHHCTEATNREIRSKENLDRLNEEIDKNCEVVIAWGAKAYYAAKKLRLTYKRTFEIVKSVHPSFSNLNRRYSIKDESLSPPERTAQRLKMLADEIKAEYGNIFT